MYALKTMETDASVQAVIDLISKPEKRKDAMALINIFSVVTGFPPKVWGTKQIGFGRYHYKYPSGHQGDFYMTGFSVAEARISLYLFMEEETRLPLLRRLGTTTAGKGCVYIKKLDGIDIEVLKEMIAESVRFITTAYPDNAAADMRPL